MSESGADFVGKLQSIALIILALAVLVAAAGYVIWLLK
ncbi:putative membrane protein [Acinetobacter sp. 1000160]|nr:putative membrane protein [Acinetobacter sp. 1000160]